MKLNRKSGRQLTIEKFVSALTFTHSKNIYKINVSERFDFAIVMYCILKALT